MNKLATADDQEDEDDDNVISVEDVQPAAISPFEALSAIRQLDLFFRSRNRHEDALYSLAQIQQQALNAVAYAEICEGRGLEPKTRLL